MVRISDNLKRIYGLDILRAAAILLVVYGHGSNYVLPQNVKLFELGNGVSVFFVLSGYLIGRILFKQIDKSFQFNDLINFWKRRWFRTLPAYFVVVTAMMIYSRHLYLERYFFIGNFISGNFHFYGESWSLAVEEWFYLLVPILFFFCLKFMRRKYLLIPVLSIILFGIVYRFIGSTRGLTRDEFEHLYRFSVIGRIDSIMWGILAAYISFFDFLLWEQLKRSVAIGIILWIVLIAWINFMPYKSSYLWVVPLLEPLAVFFAIPYLSTIKTGKGIIFKFLTFTSIISYSMYLLNLTPASAIIKGIGTSNPIIELSCFLIITFAGGYLLNRLIEKPFMSLRERSFKLSLKPVKVK